MEIKAQNISQVAPSKEVLLLGKWTRQHAIGMLCATGIAFLPLAFPLLYVVGMLSFIRLGYLGKPQWRKLGRMGGPANLVTSLRLILIVVLAAIHMHVNSRISFGLAFTIWATDLLDGYLARKFKAQSLFGEYFDKETDAFFVLIMAFVLYHLEILDLWILFPGLLRYLYVVLAAFFSPSIQKEKRFTIGRWIAGIFMGGMVCGFILPAGFYIPAMAVITALVSLSFLNSFLHLKKTKAP